MTAPTHGAKTWVEINSEALRQNIRALKGLLVDQATFCAVVKANAYGHDIETMVRLALLEGVDHFAVDSIDEAIAVRKRAPSAVIFVLGHTVPERLPDVLEYDVIQTVYDLASVDTLLSLAVKRQGVAKINLKIETGTHRQGIFPHELPAFLRKCKQEERSLKLMGVSSHFCDAENAQDQTVMIKQHNRFCEALATVNAYGMPPYVHMACSAAAMLSDQTHHTMSRFGIAMYGLWSSESLRRKMRVTKALELQPVLSWKTRIAQLKDVPVGEYIGYARGFHNDRPRRIAILPVGYYDGYRRNYTKNKHVLLHGHKCPILGIICMNMMMVDVSLVPQAKVGDTVTLLGRDGMHQISADDIAEATDTINYEIVTSINPLLPRIVT